MVLPPHEKNAVILERSGGTSCTINLHGATVTSWKVDGVEQLFLSSKAVFDEKSPIRGGIPIAFPKFGPWEDKPLHGFARIRKWSLASDVAKLANGDVKAMFALEDDDATRSVWGHRFRLLYTLLLSEKQLKTKVTVTNPSRDTPFSFELVLHTYFRISDISNCSINGLSGLTYRTKRDDTETFAGEGGSLRIDGPITRFYEETGPILELVTPERTLSIIKVNFPDTIVWNPGEDVGKTIPDLSDDEFGRFVCVEAGSCFSPVELPPGGSFQASQSLRVL